MTVHIFTTGGTIDKIYFDAKSEFHTGEPQIPRLLKEGNASTDFILTEICRKDSLDMTEDDRAQLINHVKQSQASQIIITHGTDTMATTAQALKQSILDKTIVMFGAMQPARMNITDAPFNLGFALAAVQLLPASIYIAMNGQVFEADKVVKNREQGRFDVV